MDYIILDLEWDNVFFKPQKRFVNQILQIGAVRLDSEFNVIDTYEATIRSAVSKKVSERFSTLTGITTEKMLEGIPLAEAVEGYNKFSSGAEVAMTWSNTDIYTIVDNQKTLLKGETGFKFQNYLDLQKLVQAEMRERGHDTKNQISLEAAAVLFGIDTAEYELHTALDDSRLCAKLLKVCYNEKHFNNLIRNTENPDFYKRIEFKSTPITDINDKRIDKQSLIFACPKCSSETNIMGKWKYRNRWFSARFKCKKCSHKFMARVFFKETFDNIVVKKKTFDLKVKENKDDMQPVSKELQHTAN